MTIDEMQRRNWNRRDLNGGVITEFWKPISEHDTPYTKYRLVVRFGEWKDHPFDVFLSIGNTMMFLEHVKTIDHLEALHKLLTPTSPAQEER